MMSHTVSLAVCIFEMYVREDDDPVHWTMDLNSSKTRYISIYEHNHFMPQELIGPPYFDGHTPQTMLGTEICVGILL